MSKIVELYIPAHVIALFYCFINLASAARLLRGLYVLFALISFILSLNKPLNKAAVL